MTSNKKDRIIGLVPARMAASRFPGKPLYPILGKPMIEHVYKRALKFSNWDALALATCDKEIEDFGLSQKWNVIMTSDKHTRCLDRIAEAAPKLVKDIQENDIVVCVQGDEPMLHPEMIEASIAPLLKDPECYCTVLGMDIVDDADFRNKDTVKIIHNMKGDVQYTSRAPVPYCKTLTPDVGAKRIYGIFAFRWHFLKKFTSLAESPLERVESCDSNRIFDYGYKQRVAPFKYMPSYSVDSPSDIIKVETAMVNDPIYKSYT
jgi:3-deoxy-manno-octulosonate cytidylyltransferase (CMP-KDO synthetase)